MSIHINAEQGDIAPTVLLPGDPMRAKFVAEEYFDNPRCYNHVRGMLGYTGSYKGVPVSVQGSGMGQPSLAIYVNELIRDYGVKTLIRIGSCGAMQAELDLRDMILAMSASTDSAVNQRIFPGDYAPCADFGLLLAAYTQANRMGVKVRVGPILSSDSFYQEDPESWKIWAGYGVLAVEMESNALYSLAAKNGVRALSILTVSDSLVCGSTTHWEERERTFTNMVECALSLA